MILSARQEMAFLDKFIKLGPDDCWEWLGADNGKGYGELRIQGHKCYAHHIAWYLHTGDWPSLHVLHTCDNPACVNPNHLFEGTNRDNINDKLSKDRGGSRYLTIAQRRELLAKSQLGLFSERELAKQFGVTRGCVRHITLGKVVHI